MTVRCSGKIMVRVPRPAFNAMTAAAPTRGITPSTRPLFQATHAVGLLFDTHLPPEQQYDWLIHEPPFSEIHPWDMAHQVARGRFPGSTQFAAVHPVYAEPDILHTRRIPETYPTHSTTSSNGPPWPSLSDLNCAYPPNKATDFSPAWHLEKHFGNFVDAWTYNKGQNIHIAHLDTGYTPRHMGTPRTLLLNEAWNYYEGGNNVIDPYLAGPFDQPGHGTATLALLAGGNINIQFDADHNYNGDIGGAPDAAIVIVRIGPSVIHLYTCDLAQGLDHALAPNGGRMCDVVSLSHGGLPSAAWATKVNHLYKAGAVVVAASGDCYNFGIIDVATHFTVYPSAFYRVITATGVTFDHAPYITNKIGKMQGCWGPDKVMRKAIAAYTPNVPWLKWDGHKPNGLDADPHGWDMNGGGTSASAPQIAAACALWLSEHGDKFPAGWRRVEACRHALFESAGNKGANLAQIGVGTLDAGAMLSEQTLEKVQAAYSSNQLPYAPPDQVSFPFLRLLFGLPPPGPGVDEMYETEALQVFYRSRNKEIIDAVTANPEGDKTSPPTPPQAKRLRDAFIAEPTLSTALKAHLQARVATLD